MANLTNQAAQRTGSIYSVDRKKLSFALLVLACAVLLYEYNAIEDRLRIHGYYTRLKDYSEERKGVVSSSRTLTRAQKQSPQHRLNNKENKSVTSLPDNNGFTSNLAESLNVSLDSFLSSDYSFDSDDWLMLMEARQELRVARMNAFCDRYHLRKRTTQEILARKPIRHALYANDQYRVLFGLVLKVASNHFKKAFKQLGGTKRLYLLPTGQCRERVDNYYRVLFVRNPLARMISAYKDKFIEHHIPHFIHIGRRIIGKLRKGASPAEIKSALDVTFPEFIRYLTKGPTTRANAHWDLIWRHNRVCELRYDFIGKIETIADDYRYMIHKISGGKISAADHEFVQAYRSYNGDEEKLRSEYRNISRSVLKRWHQIYRRDFELFGYNIDILGPDIWPNGDS